jgi:hypothetical protein
MANWLEKNEAKLRDHPLLKPEPAKAAPMAQAAPPVKPRAGPALTPSQLRAERQAPKPKDKPPSKGHIDSATRRVDNGAIPNSAMDAAKRLGVNLDDIAINNGVARMKIDLTSTLDPKDINQLKDVLRSRGAAKAEVDTGLIANEKLDAFLRRRIQDGKPFNGGTVRFSNSIDSEFTIDFDLQ